MNQEKIGKFIAVCRKERGLTQVQLAEKLGVTDRAVSKWENAKSMPDSSIMLPLCEILGINVNELLTGEKIAMKDYDRHAEENLIRLKKENEEQKKWLLTMEWVIGGLASAAYLILIFTSQFAEMPMPVRVLLFVLAFALLIVGVGTCLRIEQKAGYYECQHCGHKYVPSYQQVFFAMHNGRTRYMKCPECGQKSWQKKVLSKNSF